MNPLTIEQVENARVKILANAESLLAEAALLLDNGYYARAYALAHLASEEVVKIPMLVRAVMDEAAGIDFDWKKLSKRLISHTTKIDAAHFHDYLKTEIRADDSDVRAYEEALTTTPEVNSQKNNALYCGFENGEASSPIDDFSYEDAQKSVEASQERIGWVKSNELATVGRLSEILTGEYLERHRKVREIYEEHQKNS